MTDEFYNQCTGNCVSFVSNFLRATGPFAGESTVVESLSLSSDIFWYSSEKLSTPACLLCRFGRAGVVSVKTRERERRLEVVHQHFFVQQPKKQLGPQHRTFTIGAISHVTTRLKRFVFFHL